MTEKGKYGVAPQLLIFNNWHIKEFRRYHKENSPNNQRKKYNRSQVNGLIFERNFVTPQSIKPGAFTQSFLVFGSWALHEFEMPLTSFYRVTKFSLVNLVADRSAT